MTYRMAVLDSFEDLSSAIRSFRFRVSDGQPLEYTPGQWMSVALPADGSPIVRAYSIASVPKADEFEICLNLVEEGKLSPRLFRLAIGDQINFRGPLGDFLFRRQGKESLFVATGTGVVPFRAMLCNAHILAEAGSLTLLQGARYQENLIYRAEFERARQMNPSFEYIPTLTRPGPDWTGQTGRVQNLVYSYAERKPDSQIYLCGLREMVDEIRKELLARGMSKRQIFFERYN